MLDHQAWATGGVHAPTGPSVVERPPAHRFRQDSGIFITWDDYGAFYDQVAPPRLNPWGLGPCVPVLVISLYARRGYLDHTTCSFALLLRLVELRFGLPAPVASAAEHRACVGHGMPAPAVRSVDAAHVERMCDELRT